VVCHGGSIQQEEGHQQIHRDSTMARERRGVFVCLHRENGVARTLLRNSKSRRKTREPQTCRHKLPVLLAFVRGRSLRNIETRAQERSCRGRLR
jgi:hypothetical protein